MWGSWYCRIFHHAPMWPFMDRWRCRICLREYPCYWQVAKSKDKGVDPCYPKRGYSAREIGGKINS